MCSDYITKHELRVILYTLKVLFLRILEDKPKTEYKV